MWSKPPTAAPTAQPKPGSVAHLRALGAEEMNVILALVGEAMPHQTLRTAIENGWIEEIAVHRQDSHSKSYEDDVHSTSTSVTFVLRPSPNLNFALHKPRDPT